MGFLDRFRKPQPVPTTVPSTRPAPPPAEVDPRWLEVERLIGVQPGSLVAFETDRQAYALAHPDIFRHCLNEPGEFSKERFLDEWLGAHDQRVYIDRHTPAEDFLLELQRLPLVKAAQVSLRPALEYLQVPAGEKALAKAEELLNEHNLSLVGFDTLDDAMTFFVIKSENEARLDELLGELNVFRNPYDTVMMVQLWPWLDTDSPQWADHWPA